MCNCGMCYKCDSSKWIILGILVLLNALLQFIRWDIFIGILLIIKGFVNIVKPTCGHEICEPESGKSLGHKTRKSNKQ